MVTLSVMFEPISVRAYVELYVKDNPAVKKNDIEERLREMLSIALSGGRCRCGNPIWVIGAAESRPQCFTCITGEALPDEDFEIDEHLHFLQKQGNRH